jgi:diguanylate cyclase (GGDEF)-like protein/PAS domain S-box-containing protein
MELMAKFSGLSVVRAATTFFLWAIEPASSVPEKDRPNARLLSAWLLVQVLLQIALFPLLISIPAFRTAPQPEFIFFLILLEIGVYSLSRSRHTVVTAWAIVIALSLAIWLFSMFDLTSPDKVALRLAFLVFPLVLSCLLLPISATVALSVFQLMVVFLMPIIADGFWGTPAWNGLIFFTIIEDVSAVVIGARRHSEQAEAYRRSRHLDESEAQLNALMNNLPDAIYFKDGQSRFLRVSKALVAKHGLHEAVEILGTSDFDYFSRDHAQATYDIEQEIIRSGVPVVNLETPEIWPDRPPTWASVTKMPFRDKSGRVIGIFGLSRDITERKTAEHALQEANVRQSAWIGELEKRNQEIALLNQMSDLVQTCPTIDEACTVISELARLMFPADTGALYMINASRNLVEKVSSWGGSMQDAEVFSPEDCWGLRLGRPHSMERSSLRKERNGESLTIVCNHLDPPGPEAYICIPLVAQGEAIGLLHIRKPAGAAGGPGEWLTEDKQQLARSAAHRIALSLANLILREKLRQQSIRDALTGLYNRRYLEESLEREVHRVIRGNRTLGIIMLDVDHFKRFNDTYGHEAGDLVLRELGGILRQKIRAEDIACRYGGEEFALVLPDATLDITRKRAEMICEEVRSMNVVLQNRSLGSVTVSAGVACYPNHGATGEAVVWAADAALYRAKKAGRDRIVEAEPLPAPPGDE